jgi:hypothetical protein
MCAHFFCKTSAPNLQKIATFVLSIPVDNAVVECMLSVKKSLWTYERNRLQFKRVESEIMAKVCLCSISM